VTARVRQVAAHLPAVVAVGDRAGMQRLVCKAIRAEGGLYALIAMLAWAADLDRLAEVTGCDVPPRRDEARDAAAGRRAA
jgi:hypothetical protein